VGNQKVLAEGYQKAIETVTDVRLNGEFLPDLIGSDFILAPYERSLWQEDILLRLWTMAREEKTLHRLFWWQENVPEDDRNDLWNFLNYFRHKLLFLVLGEGAGKILGFIWFYDLCTDQAHMGFWYSRDSWASRYRPGVKCNLATRSSWQSLWWGFRAMGWRRVWGETPWRFALAHGRRLGAKHVATIPEYALIGGKRRPVYILRHTRESCIG